MYIRSIDAGEGQRSDSTRVVDESLFETWRGMFRAAFGAKSAEAAAISDEHTAAAFGVPASTDLLAFVDGQAAGCGSVQLDGPLAWLGGGATVPELRRRGVQSALIHHRLALASEAGCRLAAGSALPASASARNLEAHGFALAYTQVVMTRPSTT